MDFVIASPFVKKEALSHIPLRKKDGLIRRLEMRARRALIKLQEPLELQEVLNGDSRPKNGLLLR